MTQLDALFLHVPLWEQDRREVMVLPLGLPALANLLHDTGRTTELLHLGIEREAATDFSLKRTLQELAPRITLLSLHWNQQTRPVIDAAFRIRNWLPETKIVLGGLTASTFAEEAVGSLRFIDAVIRGDGEAPLLALAEAWLDGERALAEVPNLVWRDDEGLVRENPFDSCLDETLADRLRHGSLALLRHRDAYLERALYADFSEGTPGSEGYPRAAYLNAGRGCPGSCASCGGAAESQRLTSGRDGILLYSPAKLAADTAAAVAEGAQVLRTCFDPPGSRRRIGEWFQGIRSEGLSLRAIYDLWYLPKRPFLEDLARTFAADSTVVYSPDCGSEAVRRRTRAFPYSNDQLLRSLVEADELGLGTHCFFTAGLPTETTADIDETARLIERIRRETRAAVSVVPMFLDPASPVFLDPGAHGVTLIRRTLRDFYDGKGIGPGYETEHFDEQGILDACDGLMRTGS